MKVRHVIATLVLLSLAPLSSTPLLADKLVVFKNGKAMKVKSVTKDGRWLKCEFEDKNFLAVPASQIVSIEEAALGSTAGELRPNQVAAGTGGSATTFNPGPGGLGANNLPARSMEANVPADSDVELQAAIAEEERIRGGAVAQPAREYGSVEATGFGRRGTRVPTQPQNGVQGLTPLNQQANPFPNRSLTPRGHPRTAPPSTYTGNTNDGSQNPNQNQNQPD